MAPLGMTGSNQAARVFSRYLIEINTRSGEAR